MRKFALFLLISLTACQIAPLVDCPAPLEEKWPGYKEALLLIMAKQEDMLGIQYLSGPPQFAFKTHLQSLVDGAPAFFVAYYQPTDKCVVFNAKYEDTDIAALVEQLKSPAGELNPMLAFMRDTLSHELGHYFVDLLIDAEQKNSWLRCGSGFLGLDTFGRKIISEGIAEYFRCQTFPDSPAEPFEDGWWHDESAVRAAELAGADAYHGVIYGGGYRLVKPIIDKYGLKGIHYLLASPLKIIPYDLQEALIYRDEAFYLLSLPPPVVRSLSQRQK